MIFSEFSLRVQWSALPEWARWATKDSAGIIWCYENEPYLDPRSGKWGVAFGRSKRVGVSNTGNNWEALLTKRPNKQEENKVSENKLPVIDVSKTFPACVWNGDDEPKNKGGEIREIVAAFSNGECVDSHLAVWEHYELIKEPTFRPFRDRDEFFKWLRDTGRTDMRYVHPNGTLFTLNTILVDIYFPDYLDCKWFDNGEPIGVKE